MRISLELNACASIMLRQPVQLGGPAMQTCAARDLLVLRLRRNAAMRLTRIIEQICAKFAYCPYSMIRRAGAVDRTVHPVRDDQYLDPAVHPGQAAVDAAPYG